MEPASHYCKFYKDQNVVLSVLRGDVYLSDLLQSFQEVWSDKDYDPSCVGITDIRNCNLHFTDEDIQIVSNLPKASPKAILNKWSLLADVPKSVAILMMYEMMVKEYDVAIFTTWKAAINHVNVDIEDPKIKLLDE